MKEIIKKIKFTNNMNSNNKPYEPSSKKKLMVIKREKIISDENIEGGQSIKKLV